MKLHGEDRHDLCFSPTVVWGSSQGECGGRVFIARMEEKRKVQRVSMEKPEGERSL